MSTIFVPGICEKKILRSLADLSRIHTQDVIAEPKIDGIRLLWYLRPDGVHLRARRENTSGDFVDHIKRHPYLDVPLTDECPAVLDGELQHPDGFQRTMKFCGDAAAPRALELFGPCRYYVFDILEYRGEDVRRIPLYERWKLRDNVLTSLNNSQVVVVPHVEYDFQSLLEEQRRLGNDGLVAKHTRAVYGFGWYKVKPTITIDVVVMGFIDSEAMSYKKLGWIAAIVYGLYDSDGNLHRLGKVSAFTDDMRQWISMHREELEGGVIEISGLKFTRDGVMREPKFERVRSDANPKEQTLQKYGLTEGEKDVTTISSV